MENTLDRACGLPKEIAPHPEPLPSLGAINLNLSLTEKAAKHVEKNLKRRGKGIGIRVGVRTTGCSGLAYVIEYVDEQKQEDQMIESQGIQIFVDPKSVPYINGIELDFAREGLNEGFKFNNPNAKDECGCGESFRV